ncbi:hypothetical protein ACP4OV_010022 [Aristida adscensionis]
MSGGEPDTCYRWSCDFAVAHAVFASGFVTAPVAVVHLVTRPSSGAAVFFAVFAFLCTSVTLVLCCRFYAELKRPPWLSPASVSSDGAGGEEPAARRDASLSHELRRPEPPVMAADRIPSYVHRGGGGGAAVDCAVCLGEVDDGETVRRLPACRHVFHRECIDMWLRAHATCPVCRSGVLPAPERPVEIVVNIGAGHGQPGTTNPVVPSGIIAFLS